MHATPPRLQPENTVLLIVDVQEKLLPVMREHEQLLARVKLLAQACQLLDLPTLVTEQYPRGLGATVAPIRERVSPWSPVEKTRFSACVEPVIQHLGSLNRPHVVVAGIEAHVCVQQTVLDLLRIGYQPYVCVDSVSSRRERDLHVSLERMKPASAPLTTAESVIFELVGRADSDAFRAILPLVK